MQSFMVNVGVDANDGRAHGDAVVATAPDSCCTAGGAPDDDDNDDDDDIAWLSELCKAPPRKLQCNLSDEQWLYSLCRTRRDSSSGLAAVGAAASPSVPRVGAPCITRSGDAWPTPPTAVRLSGARSPPPAALVPVSPAMMAISGAPAAPQGARRRTGEGTPEPSWHPSFEQLRADLAASGSPPPERTWALPAHGAIIRALAAPQGLPQSGGVLHKCLWRICAWLQAMNNMAAFKVGIAFDPVHRWRNPDFGYMHEHFWLFMDVMHTGSAAECASLERALIASTRHLPGCYNVAPGGEGISPTTVGECRCYVVYAPAGSGLSIRAEWLARREEDRSRAHAAPQGSCTSVGGGRGS